MTASMHHISLNCRDRLAQEAFYTKHFGFRRARVFKPGTPSEFVLLRLGDSWLELLAASAEAADASGGVQPVGLSHLAFTVDCLDAAIAELRVDGIETEEVIDCGKHVEGMRVCFFADPEGNRLEIMEGYRDEENLSE